MAKKETTKREEKPEVLEEVKQATSERKGGRETRWKKFLEAAQIQNPVKYAIKEKAGQFKQIPKSFV